VNGGKEAVKKSCWLLALAFGWEWKHLKPRLCFRFRTSFKCKFRVNWKKNLSLEETLSINTVLAKG
jgi:hypothetical protein